MFLLLRQLSLLCRFAVSLMVGAATAFGYLLLSPKPGSEFVLVVAGVFSLAAACSVLNQVQERHSDALMERTKKRPVANGTVSPLLAIALGACLFVLSVALLFFAGGLDLSAWAFLIIIVYNFVYTPLKKRTCFSLLPGAAVGATPVVLGWQAAGGSLADPLLVLVYGVYLLWQIPHFWLRVERRREDYERAGLAVPSRSFSQLAYSAILKIWFQSFSVALMLLPVFPFMQSTGLRVLALCLGVLVFVGGSIMLRGGAGGVATKLGAAQRSNQSSSMSGGLVGQRAGRTTVLHGRCGLALIDGSMFLSMLFILLDRLLLNLW